MRSINVLQVDETETGPRVRKSLAHNHGIECQQERKDIAGLTTREGFAPTVDLWSYARPSNGQRLWIIEAQIFFPPDTVLYRSYVVDGEPSIDQIREIVAANSPVGHTV